MRTELVCLVTLLTAACSSKPAVATADTTPWRKPGDKVDSILPMAEHVRRFRIGVDSPASLTGGAESRDALARAYLSALTGRDTTALRRLLVSRAEFAWLVFPDHRYAAPPYELDPAILWGQLTNASAKGSHRALQRYGGSPLALRSLDCTRDTLQLVRGAGTLWGPCTVHFQARDSTLARRLFGSILERDGRYKFLSYANDF